MKTVWILKAGAGLDQVLREESCSTCNVSVKVYSPQSYGLQVLNIKATGRLSGSLPVIQKASSAGFFFSTSDKGF